jgi:hypothetical protein
MNKAKNIGLAVQRKDSSSAQPISLKNLIKKYLEMIGEIVHSN